MPKMQNWAFWLLSDRACVVWKENWGQLGFQLSAYICRAPLLLTKSFQLLQLTIVIILPGKGMASFKGEIMDSSISLPR